MNSKLPADLLLQLTLAAGKKDPRRHQKLLRKVLDKAAWRGNVELCEAVLEQGASQAPNRHGVTPLHCAAFKGCARTCSLLIRYGAKIHAREVNGRTPLHLAAYKGHASAIAVLIDEGKSEHLPDTFDQDFPLHMAARNGHTAACAALLDRGADVHATQAKGRTALALAALFDEPDTCALLLDRGADNKPDFVGKTPLFFAEGERLVSAVFEARQVPEPQEPAVKRPRTRQSARRVNP